MNYLQLSVLILTALLWSWLSPLYFLLAKNISIGQCIEDNIGDIILISSCYEDHDYFIRSASFVFGSQVSFAILFSIVVLLSFCGKGCFEPICTYEVRYWDYWANKYCPRISIIPKEEMKVQV